MVSKREKMKGLFSGVRCRVCGRKLSNPKSVSRQIGPVCWSKLETSNSADNMKLPLHKYETRCRDCKHPIADVKHILMWRQRFDELCTQYCCACCPAKDLDPCPGEKLRPPIQEQLEVFV